MMSIARARICCSAFRFAQKLSTRAFTISQSSASNALYLAASQNSIQKLSQQHKIHQCQWQAYATTAADLTQAKVADRTMAVIKVFEKINADKLTMESHFMKELGLDSLDHVELIMAIEDEFGFEIGDQDAEKLVRPSDIVKFVCQKLEVATA